MERTVRSLRRLEVAFAHMIGVMRPIVDAFARLFEYKQTKPICERCNVNEQRGRGVEPELCEECQNERFTVVAVLLLCWMAWLGAFAVTVLS